MLDHSAYKENDSNKNLHTYDYEKFVNSKVSTSLKIQMKSDDIKTFNRFLPVITKFKSIELSRLTITKKQIIRPKEKIGKRS